MADSEKGGNGDPPVTRSRGTRNRALLLHRNETLPAQDDNLSVLASVDNDNSAEILDIQDPPPTYESIISDELTPLQQDAGAADQPAPSTSSSKGAIPKTSTALKKKKATSLACEIALDSSQIANTPSASSSRTIPKKKY